MIQEYAIDPVVVCQSTETFQRFISDFGMENGRAIGAVPNKWQERIFLGINSLGLSQMGSRKAKDFIIKLAETSLIDRSAINRIEDVDWLEVAMSIHGRCNFSAILSNRSDVENKIYDYGNLIEDEPPGWRLSHTLSVQRTAEALSSAISFSLLTANAPVHFVDPYFDSRSDSYINPLRSFVELINNGRFSIKKAFIHTQIKGGGNNPRSRSELIRGFGERLLPSMPDGFEIHVLIRPNDSFHDRFVLTKQSGYSFGHGLSEEAYQDSINVNINRISENVRKELFRQFSSMANVIGDPIVVRK